MKISDRFTDYGLIGGFFWLLQLGVLSLFGLSHSQRKHLVEGLNALIAGVPPPTVPALIAFLGVLALISIFTTGLLLDLLGSSYFRTLEVSVFSRFLQRNRRWLERIVDQNRDYIQDDWSKLLNAHQEWSKANVAAAFKSLQLWKARHRQELRDANPMRLRTPYTRFQSFLLSYVLLTTGVEKIELLSTQMALWSTSRAIAMAMMLSSTLTPTLVVARLEYDGLSLLVFWLVMAVLTGIAFAVSYCAHARVCATLFAFAYVIANKSSTAARRPAFE
jgi:hypothetical protein